MKFALNFVVAILVLAHSPKVFAGCPPTELTVAQLDALKAKQWQIADAQQRQATAIGMLACLASPNPHLRDEIAFEALSFWMRGELLSEASVQQIRQRLLKVLVSKADDDGTGFGPAFAALGLAEVARVDRRKAFLSEAQRQEMVIAAARYMSDLRDYRGYDEKEGWRHGLAHAADWMMQLSLNPALSKSQHQLMLEALAKQIGNDRHFFVYGEGERLMAPVFYLGLRSALTAEEWQSWFAGLLQTSLDLTKTTQKRLARSHNLKAFLYPFYVNLREGKQTAAHEKLLPIVLQTLKGLD